MKEISCLYVGFYIKTEHGVAGNTMFLECGE
jgi:hypothetical protein